MTEKAHVNIPFGSSDGTLNGALATGFIPLPLTNWREVAANDVQALAASGGVLAKDSTPILEFTNGDTDSAMRLRWAASDSNPIAIQTPLPPDLSTGAAVELHVVAAMSGSTDSPALDLDSFFGVGDTKVEDSATIDGTAVTEYTLTIAAGDVPSGAMTASFELTPAAHTTDALYIYGAWVEYTRTQ